MGPLSLRGRHKGYGAAEAHRRLWDAPVGDAPAAVARVGLRPGHLRAGKVGEGVPAQLAHAEHLGDTSVPHPSVLGVSEPINAKPAAGREGVTMGLRVGLVPEVGWALRVDAVGRCVP